MKIYRSIVLLLDAALGLAATVVLFLWAGDRLDTSFLVRPDPAVPLAGIKTTLLASAAGIVAANVLLVVFALFRLRSRTIQTPIDGGKVSVAISAVEQSLARTACALPDVRDVRVRIVKRSGKSGGLRVRADYMVWEGTAVKETTRRLQEVLRMRIQDIVGAEIPLHFDIRLAGIVLKETKKPEEKRKKDRGAPPYGGPVYPIDESI
jgi:hypothetical protein